MSRSCLAFAFTPQFMMPDAPLKRLRHEPHAEPAELTEGCMRLRATGLVRAQLAVSLGVSPQSAGRWLLGRSRPTAEKAIEIYKLFGIDPRAWHYLAGWRG
jgi:plasmid maintenance system antidote protein VapI